MRQRRALRPPGGAAREQDDEGIVFVDRCVGERRLAARRDLGRELFPTQDGRVDLRARLGDALESRLVTDQHLRLGELHAVGELGPGPPSVQTGDDRARHDAGPDRERVLDCVRARDRDAVALAHAVLVGEHRCVRRDATGQVAVGDRLVAEHEVRRVTVLLGRADHDVAHVARTLGEDTQLLAQHLLLDQLERCTGSAQHVPDVVRQQLIVAPLHRELEITGVGHAVSPRAR